MSRRFLPLPRRPSLRQSPRVSRRFLPLPRRPSLRSSTRSSMNPRCILTRSLMPPRRRRPSPLPLPPIMFSNPISSLTAATATSPLRSKITLDPIRTPRLRRIIAVPPSSLLPTGIRPWAVTTLGTSGATFATQINPRTRGRADPAGRTRLPACFHTACVSSRTASSAR